MPAWSALSILNIEPGGSLECIAFLFARQQPENMQHNSRVFVAYELLSHSATLHPLPHRSPALLGAFYLPVGRLHPTRHAMRGDMRRRWLIRLSIRHSLCRMIDWLTDWRMNQVTDWLNDWRLVGPANPTCVWLSFGFAFSFAFACSS